MTTLSWLARTVGPKRSLRPGLPHESDLFPTDGPVPPDGLIGRHEEVSALVDALTQGKHQALTGSRAIGKTSVARAAVAALEDDGWSSATVDLFHLSDLPALTDCLVEAASRLRPEGASQLGEDGRPGSIGEAIAVLGGVAEADDRRMVLLVDGLHELVTTQLYGNPDELTNEMRAALDEAPNLACLFVGSIPYLMRQLFTSEDQGFYQLCDVAGLAPIPVATWHEGLRSRFDNGGCDIVDAALERLVQLSSAHPRSTMLVARSTYALAQTRATNTIDQALVEEGLRSALAGQHAAHENELTRVRTLGKHTLPTTLQVANDRSPYKNLAPAIARQTLRSLETAGVVEHPRDGAWHLVDPLFREYLLHTLDSTADASEATESAATPSPGPAATTAIDGATSPDRSPATGRAATSSPASATTMAPDDATAPDRPKGPDHDNLSIRHPRPDEADVVGHLVTQAVARNGTAHQDARARTGQGTDAARQSTSRLGRFIERTVAQRPEWYWQLEENGRAVGGLVLYRPRALLGSKTAIGMDPLVQLGLLVLIVTLAVGGVTFLVVQRAWTWGGVGGLLGAAFIACLVQAVLWGKGALGRARSSWIARRHGATMVEGLWSQPEALQAVFAAVAKELPGTLLTAHAATRERLSAYRALGFRVGGFRVVVGTLDPTIDPPVRVEQLKILKPPWTNGKRTAPERTPTRDEPVPNTQPKPASTKKRLTGSKTTPTFASSDKRRQTGSKKKGKGKRKRKKKSKRVSNNKKRSRPRKRQR